MTSLLNKAANAWTVRDSERLYRIPRWGAGYYVVNEEGHLSVRPFGNRKVEIDLSHLVRELCKRKIEPPMLIRFMDILADRIRELHRCFGKAVASYHYQGRYLPVYPIKVNQQQQVVEAMVREGRKVGLGLEVGSKPELLAVLALSGDSTDPIICNGYKDEEFIETALYAKRLGKNVVLVVEKLSELDRIIQAGRRVEVPPSIGVRIKLASRGEGRWAETTGDNSKFGLRVPEVISLVERLRAENMMDALSLIHFHLGSQITRIDRIKSAMSEVARMYAELRKLGVNITYVDVGGGLGIDYEGGGDTPEGPGQYSVNYTPQEYANDIVFALAQVCNQESLPHPNIISESGRALTAHYSVLIANVVDQSQPHVAQVPQLGKSKRPQLREMQEIYDELTVDNCREYYHDAAYLRRASLDLFNVGYYTLEERAQLEDMYWAIMHKINAIRKDNDLDFQEFEGLDLLLASTYFVNFSLFQSLPDAWAINQVFPIVPIQRLDQKPQVNATLADITCDSDGKVDHYICDEGHGTLLPLHTHIEGENYYIGFFLVGAYQEILGDLHNLFGDTNAVHIVADRRGGYKIDHLIKGDSVSEVLGYLEYNPAELIEKMRVIVEHAVTKGSISVEDSADFLRLYEEGLLGYTYLED